MKLYYTKAACSLACRIVINEIGLACDYVAVDLEKKRTAAGDDFLKINPKGAVPVLEIADGKILTENAVIQQYLADTNKATRLLPSVDDFKRYQVLEWLNYVATELHKGLGIFFKPNLPQELKDSFFIPNIQAKLSYVDACLAHKNI